MISNRGKASMGKIRKKEQQKVVRKTVIITAIISILLFSFFSYNIYQKARFNECIEDQGVLIAYDEGKIELINQGDINESQMTDSYEIWKDNQLTIVKNSQNGYTKVYKNNVLMEMYVENYMADFVSYFNPLVWFGGSRNVNQIKLYEIRNEEEYEKVISGESGNKFWQRDSEVIMVKGEEFIN